MKTKSFVPVFSIFAVTLFGALVGLRCSTTEDKVPTTTEKTPATSKAVSDAGGSEYSIIAFNHGSDMLTQSAAQTLREFAKRARAQEDTVEEIKVLAWSDRDYPTKGQEASRADIELADRRADRIRTYLREEMNRVADVDTHNMAKRPNFLNELLKTEDYEVKASFEKQNSYVNSESMRKKLLSESKTSKAVIFIEYKT